MRREFSVGLALLLAACGGGGGHAGGDAAPPVAHDGFPPPIDGAPADAGPVADATPSPDARPLADATPPDAAPIADAVVADARVSDAAPDAAPPAALSLPPGDWPRRACDHVVRYTGPAQRVQIGGEFTGWADGPLDLSNDGGVWEIRLQPGDRLRPGRYAYKLIVDGRWILDPDAPLRKWDGNCINSAFDLPDCGAGPEVQGRPVTTTFDGGTAQVEVPILAASDGSMPRRATIALDGAPLPDGAARAEVGRIVVSLAGLARGRHVLEVGAEDEAGRQAAPIALPFWIEPRPFDWRGATLYMLLIDRFAQGDAQSDRPVGPPVQYPADWHGGDLWGALRVLQSGYFESLGVDAIWLSPVNTQADGHETGLDGSGQEYSAYHGYWPVRGRQVDPRYGGDAALHAFVDEAHRRGIRVLLDLIQNQVHQHHEYVPPHPDWFRTSCVCGIDPGCGWSERPFDCLFAPYLPDINWRNPATEDQFVADALWWIDTFGVDGFRVDAVKHVESNAIYDLRAALARRFEQGGARVVMLGETAVGEGDHFEDGCGESYGDGYAWIDAYTGPRALDGQFDFPSHHRMQEGLLNGQMGYDALEGVVADMERRYRPDALHVRFLGSHDTSRMASRAAVDPARDCRWQGGGACAQLAGTPRDPEVYRRLQRAFAALMTMPGLSLLYYGDEIALAGGNDPDNRRNMAWDGGLAQWALGVATPTEAQLALREWVGALGRAKQQHPALRAGRRVPLLVEPDLYVYARATPDDLAVVVLNRGGAVADRRITGFAAVGEAHDLTAIVGRADAVVDGDALTVSIPAGGAAVLVRTGGGP